MFVFCSKCGLISKKSTFTTCPVCAMTLEIVPDAYLTASKNLFLSQEARTDFIKNVIETNPVFDKKLASSRDVILKENEVRHQKEVNQKVFQYKENRITYKCPVCGSDNLSAISTIGKVAKISLFGVWGAGDLGKKRYCNSCGSKF